MDASHEAQRLRRDVEWALQRALDPAEVLPLLHRLARTARAGSDESTFAHRQLAELLAERHPWRAALHARRVLVHRPGDDRAWAVLALCQTLLGNYRFATSAYQSALAASPHNPWYAHNLGHILDVALGRPDDALPWLRTAYADRGDNGEIAASYAHALARAGKLAEARRVLLRAMKRSSSREHSALLRWLEQGAPAGAARDGKGTTPQHRLPPTIGGEGSPRRRKRTPLRESERPAALELEATLARGLAHLPFDPKQRARARALARDVISDATRARISGDLATQSLAAAIAYAIVYIDHVPLTQAEVAAPFRVGVARLRGRFAELRARLALTPGDARYATLRG